jgi:hypothetical protein
MSTIRVDTFGPSAGGTTYSARGIAKAWVNFNGTGTIAARDSENVSSLTDNGTGNYTVNFTSAFGAADYANSGSAGDTLGLASRTMCPYEVQAGLFKLFVVNQFSGAAVDANLVFVSNHGDLA